MQDDVIRGPARCAAIAARRPVDDYTRQAYVVYTMQSYVGYGMSLVERATGIIRSMTSAPEHESSEKNPVFTAVGHNLKQMRLAAGMSQAELAFAAEINRTFVSEIERGLANPTVLTLATLCYVLEVTLSELFSEVEACPPGMVEGRRRNAAKPKRPTQNRRLR